MARRAASEGGVNVSAKIREYRKTHRRAKPKTIADALAEQGVTVSAAYVSTILSTDRRKKKGKGAAGDKTEAPRRGRPSTASKFDDLVNELKAVKQLVDKMGGVEKAQAALSALAKLS